MAATLDQLLSILKMCLSLLYKTSYLIVEVYCAAPSSSVRIP
jgi:hypothetical protein